jgi:hypothetical protein
MNKLHKKETADDVSLVNTVPETTQSVNIEALLNLAIKKQVPVETLERLLTMRSHLKAEWAKEQYNIAMTAFQSECPTIQKNKQGYGYKYADLAQIDEQTKAIRAKHGLSYSFDTEEKDNGIVILCTVKHIAGHHTTTKVFIDKETTTKMNASQQSGAVMTYGKRYAFQNAFGILTGDEDTDAAPTPPLSLNQLSPAAPALPKSQLPPVAPVPPTSQPQKVVSRSTASSIGTTVRPASDKQLTLITTIMADKGITQEALIDAGFSAIINLTSATASELIDYLLKAKPAVG